MKDISVLAGGNKHDFCPSVSSGIAFSNPAGCFFPQSWVFSLHAFAYPYYAEYSKDFLCRSPQFSFCAFLSSLVVCPVISNSFFSLQTLKLYLLNSDSASVPLHAVQHGNSQCSKIR